MGDEYLMDFIPGEHGGDFRVDVVCTNEQLEGNDTVGSRDFHARRLVAAYSELDQWVDNMDDHEINYFYNLLMNGQMDRVMDAFYDHYYDDETPSLNGVVTSVKHWFTGKPYTGDPNDPDALRYGFVKNEAVCQPLGTACEPWDYTFKKDPMSLTRGSAEHKANRYNQPNYEAQRDYRSQGAKVVSTESRKPIPRNGNARNWCCSGYCKISSEMAAPGQGTNYWGKCGLTPSQDRSKHQVRRRLEKPAQSTQGGV